MNVELDSRRTNWVEFFPLDREHIDLVVEHNRIVDLNNMYTSGTHTGKAKCRPWTLNEEVELAKSWVEVTEDPTIGNYKKRVDNYWTSIKASFDTRMNYDPKVRSGDALPTKVRMLIASVSKFACVYNNVANSRTSGEDDVMVLNRAKDRYHRENGKSFPYEHAWRVVKDSPKFDPVIMMDPRNICAPKINGRERPKPQPIPPTNPMLALIS
ncbi:hypothetical protein OSB04_007709 [Centaurea solstitialis]|uniref:Uncharacterized protein n=1 Tax=Centaurea solstitialis TaxID=347529 RepID=A0AA38WSQ9_9ASTR|nr:hypothetical protein OSB04_007709 [Centaurea solstitialis]